MKYKDLRAEVLSLGFENEIDSEERLLFAARRAMNVIFTERPFYKTLTLSQPKITPVLKIPVIEHKGGCENTVRFSAKAYSFITSGIGAYTVTDGDVISSHTFNRNEKIHRGFLHGEGSITFKGEYHHTVYDLSFFDEIYGDGTSDIPLLDGEWEYEIKNYTDDFLAPVSPPEDEYGTPIIGASVRAGILSVPTDFHGRVILKYKASPSLTSGDLEEELTLPDGCRHLLPLLVSAYIWLDDDTEKSEYYMMLYREGMAALHRCNRTEHDIEYTVKDGWA